MAAREQPYRIGREPPRDELTRVMKRVLELSPDEMRATTTCRELIGTLDPHS
ncbi:hypothetical protein ACFC0C_03715 [Streptomyces sp. NPDC056178]|uniref:hypothetical protein n=1 Tax=Streptomyces sp. NPDC056178 TaxID=3345735 RepID=UPI0035E375CC